MDYVLFLFGNLRSLYQGNMTQRKIHTLLTYLDYYLRTMDLVLEMPSLVGAKDLVAFVLGSESL